MSVREAAIEAVLRHGWHVFRVRITHEVGVCDGGRANCKRLQPQARWRETSTDDAAAVAAWDWNGWNGYGIDCGRSGIAVVDQDPGAVWPFNGTLVLSTGRGLHHVYADWYGIANATAVPPWGIDLRGIGGFILGPGSWHPHGSYAYRAGLREPAAPLEPALVGAVGAVRESVSVGVEAAREPDLDPLDALDRLGGVLRRVREAPQGSRNTILNKQAGMAAKILARVQPDERVGGLDPQAVRADLSAAAMAAGLEAPEIAATLSSGWSWGETAPLVEGSGAGEGVDLWTAHPVFTHIRTVAWNRGLPAPSVLVGVLAELALHIGPHVVLPPASAAIAPLNVGFALLGDSGAAKTSSARLGAAILGLERRSVWHGGMGSGEGLIDAFYRWVPKDPLKPDGAMRLDLQPLDERRFLLTIDEAEALARVKEASTLPAYLRSGISGSDLSNTNTKSGGNKRHVPELTYRLVCVIGVHPDQADVLLGDAGNGFPQRFCWVRAADPDMPTEWDQRPALPGGEVGLPGWELPHYEPDPVTGFHVVGYPDGVEREVWEHNARQMKEGKDPLEAHIMLVRLKVGVLLSALMGEARLSPLGWELAGVLARQSLSAQHTALARMSRNQVEAEKSRLTRSAEAAGEVEDDRMARCVDAVVRKLRQVGGDGEWLTWRACRPAGRVRVGLDMDAVRTELLSVEGVEIRERQGRGGGWEFRWVSGTAGE